MTDLADHPPHFWIEPGLDQTLVCGTPHAAAQALAAGYAPARLRQTSGMILRPSFYRATLADRSEQRRALGLDSAAPIGIVMFGGHGSVQMLRIAKLLRETPLIFACGHNAALLAELKALKRPAPHAAVGFTQDVGALMRAADFFIGKPGPGSLSEAIHLGLPVISFDNAWVMPQERYNVQWLREQQLGLVVRSLRGLRAAAAEMARRWPEFRTNALAVENRAVFEVLEVFDELLARADGYSVMSNTGAGSGTPAACGAR
jgi:1,2-diacylglycerol 3-beta-galactosyltransferase